MTRWQSIELGLLNKRTGELYDAEIRLRRQGTGGKWMKIWQDGKAELLRRSSSQLHGQSYYILHCLDGMVKWGNIIPLPPEVATVLNKRLRSVYRAYAELIEANIIIKRKGVYYLSPLYCWKGNTKQLEETYQKLFAPTETVKQLSETIN